MTGPALDDLRAGLAGGGHPLYLGAGRDGWVTAGPERAALVLGPPRSGKTSAVVIPAVLAASGPVVSTSTKPDVLAATRDARSELGRLWVFDPSGQVEIPTGAERLRWSPVPACTDWDHAVLLARAMVHATRPTGGRNGADAHWLERAEALLAPLLHAAAVDGMPMAGVVRWVNRRDAAAPVAILDRGGHPLAVDVLAGVTATEEREQSGIWSTAAGVLAAYRSDAALESSASSDIDARDFVGSADTIYICSPARQQDLAAPLVVGLLSELQVAAYAVGGGERGADHGGGRGGGDSGGGPGSGRGGRGGGPPLVFALDEVANIAPLPDLPGIVAEGGSQGLLVLACLQDLSQARSRWGGMADGFLSLFGATVVLPGIADVRTLEALSSLSGETEYGVRSATRATGGRRSTTRSTRRGPRLPVDQITRGRSGQALLFRAGQVPAWFTLTPWYATDPFRAG